MKNLKVILAAIAISLVSCSKSDSPVTETPVVPSTPAAANVTSLSTTIPVFNFSHKAYYQTPANATNRKGLIILAHGDGGSKDDATLNDQCTALANMGYVAVTTSYRVLPSDYTQSYVQFKTDMEKVIQDLTALYNIDVTKVMLGGLSRGGNLSFNMFLPPNAAATITPTALNLKGAILMCAGGDNWKGTAIKKPVLYMNNEVDAAVDVTSATAFKTGLTTNSNANVSAWSKCLIIAGSGHCTSADQYKAHITSNINSFY